MRWLNPTKNLILPRTNHRANSTISKGQWQERLYTAPKWQSSSLIRTALTFQKPKKMFQKACSPGTKKWLAISGRIQRNEQLIRQVAAITMRLKCSLTRMLQIKLSLWLSTAQISFRLRALRLITIQSKGDLSLTAIVMFSCRSSTWRRAWQSIEPNKS